MDLELLSLLPLQFNPERKEHTIVVIAADVISDTRTHHNVNPRYHLHSDHRNINNDKNCAQTMHSGIMCCKRVAG